MKLAAALLIALCSLASGWGSAQERKLAVDALRSGITFAGNDVRAMQADDFGNPGMLWVERGEKLWRAPAGRSGKPCAGCHDDAGVSMKGVAARYPALDRTSGVLVNLQGRVNLCRTRHQNAEALPLESEALLALTGYVAYQSRGLPVHVSIDGRNRPYFERGRETFYRRLGQMNLSCAQCHEANWGKRLYAETISQGHGNGYPAYRLEWQTFGSLERRLRACYSGVRAEMPAYGSAQLLELELYLAWRGEGLPIEAPGVRR
ncbi:MAG TPA: sulfur oxidation c-type cytochrome SoxA [Burkholderiales bacterium]|nr:sulfur oxidation c-type cytochrome SoxA [Burkholderiales bacterium]